MKIASLQLIVFPLPSVSRPYQYFEIYFQTVFNKKIFGIFLTNIHNNNVFIMLKKIYHFEVYKLHQKVEA